MCFDATGQGWLQSLEVENERLQGELDALRQRAVTTPQHELRTKNERLVSQLRELENGDKTRAQLGYEVAELKQQLDQMRRANGKNSTAALRRQVKVGIVRGCGMHPYIQLLLSARQPCALCLKGCNECIITLSCALVQGCYVQHRFDARASLAGVIRVISNSGHTCAVVQEFTLNTQMDLERQMAAMQSRALVAEEQLQSLQHYIAQSTVAYQKEIMRLRNMLSDVSQAPGVAADVGNDPGVNARLASNLHRSGSAGDALHRPLSARAQQPELRPIRSATNRQGRLPRPMNQSPAVDAWHAQ
jgi:hypothetical protein